MITKTTTTALVTVALAVLEVGCGASALPPPNDESSAAEADVGRAQAGGAPAVPDAMLHLQLAQEDLQKAKLLIGKDDARANTLTSLARAEAQLAFSLARQAAAQDQARTAQGELRDSTGR